MSGNHPRGGNGSHFPKVEARVLEYDRGIDRLYLTRRCGQGCLWKKGYDTWSIIKMCSSQFFWGWEEEEEASWIIMVKYFVFCFVFFCFLYHPSALIERFEDRKPVLTRLSQINLDWLSSKSPLLPSGTGLWPVHRGSRRRRYPSKTRILGVDPDIQGDFCNF